jgi:phosphatidylethanolamine-binding protein (PEBP) family uncharacterized protein
MQDSSGFCQDAAMKTARMGFATLLLGSSLLAHEWHDHGAVATPGTERPILQLAALGSAEASYSRESKAHPLDAMFAAFAPQVKTRRDARYLYVESEGLPAHPMMIGITAWQQQVPLPQPYTGANAWQIPLTPEPSATPVSIRGRFLRGAIAVAANGIPIFNPQNNRGEVSQEIGELDEWGGHCGRADDYHYHAAPLHLAKVLGTASPIAVALDGYAIYSLTEPDGSTPVGLDAFNGHETPKLGYHYHASTRYPYVNGGFHGRVTEAGGQVDPQPRAQPVRPDLPPLRGAKITGFTASPDHRTFALQYTVNGTPASVNYNAAESGAWKFQFVGADGTTRNEVYRPGDRRGGGGGGAGPGDRENGRNGPDQPDRPDPPRRERPRADAAPGGEPPASTAAEIRRPVPGFVLKSPAVSDGGMLPVEFTGDGAGISPPLEWDGAPAGTAGYALAMHHMDPEGRAKWYWTLYNLPAATRSLPKNVSGVGTLGNNGINRRLGYAPPHSKGPGAKTYVLTLYALSSMPVIADRPESVSRDVLLNAIRDRVLATAELKVVAIREGATGDPTPPERPREDRPRPSATAAGNSGTRREPRGDSSGLVKPTLADTLKVNVYADNWFMMYINGKLRAVDPIEFTPHNVVTVDILPEYPMTIAILAKDNADPKTGLEYGNHIGDGGFIIKFADGTVSNATWKAKNFFRGPLNRDVQNPKVEHTPLPQNWYAVDFDDSAWPAAVEFTEERVNPKEAFYQADFKGAKFIWTSDLDLDNTVIFRTRIEKPGWKPRWNTRPDLDIREAPVK